MTNYEILTDPRWGILKPRVGHRVRVRVRLRVAIFFPFFFCLFYYVLATRKKNTSEHREKRLKSGLFQSEVYIGILS